MSTETLAAWATVAAVVVALTGPVLLEWLRYRIFRPKLSLRPIDAQHFIAPWERQGALGTEIILELANAPKRPCAEDVQVLVTASAWHPGPTELKFVFAVATGAPLESETGSTTSVPAGAIRPLAFGRFLQNLDLPETPIGSPVATLNTTKPTSSQLLLGYDHEITVEVAGSNFDAKRWHARLVIQEMERHDDQRWLAGKWTMWDAG